MKKTVVSVLTLSVLLSSAILAQPGEQVRDPFRFPSMESPTISDPAPVTRPGLPDHSRVTVVPTDEVVVEFEAPEATVTGIVSSPLGNVALVEADNRTLFLREGDSLGKLTVSSIQERQVVLRAGNQKFVLPFESEF